MQLPMGQSSPPSSTKSLGVTTTETTSAVSEPIPFRVSASGDGFPQPPPVQLTRPLFVQPIEDETPGPEKDLVHAMKLVAHAVTERIAYHQAQINALRRALEPFGNMARQGVTGDGPSADDAITELLAIAGKLKDK